MSAPRLLLVGLALLLGAVGARAETLVISLSSHQVAITSNYSGSQVVLFGAVQRDSQTVARSGPYQSAVIVRGPPQTLTVRRLQERGFVWINGAQQKFAEVPAYYAALSSGPLDELAAPAVRQRLRLGLAAVAQSPGEPAELDREFSDALVRLRAEAGLYIERERGVTFLTPTIFRAAIPLSASAPPGTYEVEVLLFADGVLLGRDITHFELVKIGFEQRIAGLAETNALLYGIGTAALAVLLGWFASVVFRRD